VATAADDKQSATARRSGSGGFFKEEDLTAPNWSCSLALPGLFREELNVEDIGIDGDWCTKSLGNYQQRL
jgi:hypothetical protein